MSRADLLSNQYLAHKLAQAQEQLAGSVAGRPGSHPHPRRVLKELSKKPGYEYAGIGITPKPKKLGHPFDMAPKPKRKRKKKIEQV